MSIHSTSSDRARSSSSFTFSGGTALNNADFFLQHGLLDANAQQGPGPDGAPYLDSANQAFALFARISVPEAAPLLLMTLTFGSLLLSSRGGGGPRLAI